MWFFFAFLVALCEAIKDVVSKKTMRRTNEYVVAWSWMLFSLPLLAIAVYVQGVPTLGPHFWYALAGGVVVVATSFNLYMKAIKMSDLSMTLPMIAFTPLFLLVTSPVMVGEFPGPTGLIGILFIVAGSYVLNIKERKQGILAPYRALLRERGPKLMLLVAFIWSLGANIDKIGVQNSSTFFWSLAVFGTTALLMTPFVLWQTRHDLSEITRNTPWFMVIGLLMGIATMSQMTAITMTLVPYVIAVKRSSILFGVLFGTLFFKETGLRERLLGVIIMLVGVVCIALS